VQQLHRERRFGPAATGHQCAVQQAERGARKQRGGGQVSIESVQLRTRAAHTQRQLQERAACNTHRGILVATQAARDEARVGPQLCIWTQMPGVGYGHDVGQAHMTAGLSRRPHWRRIGLACTTSLQHSARGTGGIQQLGKGLRLAIRMRSGNAATGS
jgi:hypothetical protein